MSTLSTLILEARAMVMAGVRALKNPNLSSLVRLGAQAGGLADQLNAILDMLGECFTAISKALQALVEPLRQARLVVAVSNVAGPLMGGLAAALGALGTQLGRLIPAIQPPKQVQDALASVSGLLDRAAAWAKDELPLPEEVTALAVNIGKDLIEALNNLRPSKPTQLALPAGWP